MEEPKIGVYKAIVAVQAALAKEGIAKDRKCTQGATYNFRGIDDVYNALAPFLSDAHLCILPRMLKREVVERVSKSGGALFYTTVDAEFDFVSSDDGSKHTVGPMYGEAMDSGDKGTNKAMSAAYKYAAFQAFCIPTEGDNDTENKTHEVKGKKMSSDFEKEADQNCKTVEELGKWYKASLPEINKMDKLEIGKINAYVSQLKAAIMEASVPQSETIICPENDKEVLRDSCAGKKCLVGCPVLSPITQGETK